MINISLTKDQILFLRRLYGFNNVKITFSTSQLNTLLKSGYRFCAGHNYLVYTRDLLCPICRKKFRTTVRNKRKGKKEGYLK